VAGSGEEFEAGLWGGRLGEKLGERSRRANRIVFALSEEERFV